MFEALVQFSLIKGGKRKKENKGGEKNPACALEIFGTCGQIVGLMVRLSCVQICVEQGA